MNKKLYSFFAIMGMVIAIGTAAFTAPKQNNETLYWFEVDEAGGISETHTGSSESSCPVIPPNKYCEVAFDTPIPPVSSMSETTVENGSQPVSEIRYKP